jgi:hypothetical protein
LSIRVFPHGYRYADLGITQGKYLLFGTVLLRVFIAARKVRRSRGPNARGYRRFIQDAVFLS